MRDIKPRRIFLRFKVTYELEEAAVIERIFAVSHLDPADDFDFHPTAPNESTTIHIIPDMNCKNSPSRRAQYDGV